MSAVTTDLGARRRTPLAAAVGVAGGALGVVAGLVELTVGPSIRSWVGNKQDTTGLGLTTVLLATIALGAAIGLRSPRAERPAVRLLLTVGLAVPAAIGLTTVGRLWWLPGALLLAAAGVAATGLRGQRAAVASVVDRHLLDALVVVLGICSAFLGATAIRTAPVAACAGIAGGLLTLAVVVAAGRLTNTVIVAGLVVATVPFAVLTWWSVITPLLALATLTVGLPALTRRRCRATAPDPGDVTAGRAPTTARGTAPRRASVAGS